MRFKNLQDIGSPFDTLPEYCLLHSPSMALISSLPWQHEIGFKFFFLGHTGELRIIIVCMTRTTPIGAKELQKGLTNKTLNTTDDRE
jgi:hypothetical protein